MGEGEEKRKMALFILSFIANRLKSGKKKNTTRRERLLSFFLFRIEKGGWPKRGRGKRERDRYRYAYQSVQSSWRGRGKDLSCGKTQGGRH